MNHGTAAPGWFRLNRWWLPALPVALAGVLAASAMYVRPLWYDRGFHHAVGTAQPGQYARATLSYDDHYGKTSRTFQVRLQRSGTSALAPAGEFDEPSLPPKGTESYVLFLDWKADPDQVLFGCKVTLVDDHGRQYQATDDLDLPDPCVPEDQPGPEGAYDSSEPRGYVEKGAARPPTWTTSPRFLVPVGVHLTQVRIWWDLPDYVALPVPTG
jgi:hypothetical protein